MRHALQTLSAPPSPALAIFQAATPKDQFQQHFRCALAQCVRRGFQVEECFGMIWEETLEEVELSFREQNELFPELIAWAKRWIQ